MSRQGRGWCVLWLKPDGTRTYLPGSFDSVHEARAFIVKVQHEFREGRLHAVRCLPQSLDGGQGEVAG